MISNVGLHSFMLSFNKYLLRVYHVPGVVWELAKQEQASFCSDGAGDTQTGKSVIYQGKRTVSVRR